MTDPRRPIPTPAPSEPPSRPTLALAEGVRFTVGAGAGEVNILRGVDLRLAEGEAVGLVGPSGSGKTSLLMLLAGLERASAGRLVVAGRELARLDEDSLARFRRDTLGIVFQAFHLVPTMTALENVAIPLEFAGRGDAFHRARAALESVGLGHRLAHYPGQLSGGEQQRVLIARALAQSAKILLLDEPTAHLDLKHQAGILSLVRDLAKTAGYAILIALHDLNLAAMYADRVALLSNGALVALGTPPEVLTADRLSPVYGLNISVYEHPVNGGPWIMADDR